MTELEKLAELRDRLRRKVPSGQYTIGSAGASSDGKISIGIPSVPIMVLANPDGPEAADLIDRIISPSPEDVEVVARGMWDDDHLQAWDGPQSPGIMITDYDRDVYRRHARAAIAAMGRLGRDG